MPEIMIPRQVTACETSTGSPSTVNGMSPSALRLNPVAETTMSASSSSPDEVRMPVSVKVSMVSVTTEARPSLIAVKMSPSGTTAIRCCHGR